MTEDSGKVISLNKNFSLANELDYDQDYIKDEQTMNTLVWLYDEIKRFYSDLWALPQDLWSLYGWYEDTTTINPYNYDIGYRKIDKFCYKVAFAPKSTWFKNYFHMR